MDFIKLNSLYIYIFKKKKTGYIINSWDIYNTTNTDVSKFRQKNTS